MKNWILLLVISGWVASIQAQPCGTGTLSANQTICSGTAPAQLSVSGSESGAHIQWQSSTNNSTFTSLGADDTLTTYQPGILTATRYYRIRVTGSSCDTSYSSSVTVTVEQPPTTAPTAISGYSGAICSGSSLTLTASGGNPGSGADYQWGTGVVNDGNALFTGNPFLTGSISTNVTYWVRLKGNTTCQQATGHISKVIVVHQPPTAPTGIDGAEDPLCNGSHPLLQASGGDEGSGADYVWGSGSVVGLNTLDTTDNGNFTTSVLNVSTTFWVRRIAAPASACTNTTAGVSQLVSIRPALSLSITNPGELCQLPGQPVEIINETAGQPELHILWSSANGQNGSQDFTTSTQILLNMENASGSSNLSISSFEFLDAPNCTNVNVVSEVFDIKPRPAITTILHDDLTPSDNPLCQGYGPVQFDISTPDTVDWEGSYFINGQLNEAFIDTSPFNLQTDSAGNHTFVVDTLWYTSPLNCGYNPADYDTPDVYSHSVTIKPTPPAVELVDGTPSIVQFCNYASPLVVDSVATINDLDVWVENGNGYTIEWKDSNDNSAPSLNDIPLVNGQDYFPVYELNGCHSILDDQSQSILIDLLPLPNLLQSDLIYADSICSGVPFDILFDPAENISHFSILDYSFNDPLSTTNITDTASFPNIPGLNFSISNSGNTSASWTANIFAQNKNISEINPVTCWAEPIAIDILVNPNATLTPATTHFESCQQGPDFTIDPGWNGIGEVEWDDPLGLPAPTSIDNTTKIITVDMTSGIVPSGVYPIHISGGYPGSDCVVDTTFTIEIFASPEIETHILDVDGTICHNEYTHIEIVNPDSGVVYDWKCTSCLTDPAQGTYFLPHWDNPDPGEGNWSDNNGTYTVTATDTTTSQLCSSQATITVNILADYASCPEGIDFFEPSGLSLVDAPALYFQWYDVEADTVFSKIAGATDQTYFPADDIDSCNPSLYIATSSLYADKCWSTTVNCFEGFGSRECNGPKSKAFFSDFQLYPNPVTGDVVILENLDSGLKGRYYVELFDITGKTLLSEIIRVESTGKKLINLPQLVSGIYLFRISNAKYAQTFKLIIN